MTDLLFQTITGPESGEGTNWWQLRASSSDLTNGVLFDNTLYIHPFDVETSTFEIGDDVERVLFPSVNVKIDRNEIRLVDGINSNDIKVMDSSLKTTPIPCNSN